MKKIILSFAFILSVLGLGSEVAEAQSAITPNPNFVFNSELILNNENVQDYTGLQDNINPNPNISNPGAYYIRNIITAVIRFIERFFIPIGIVFLSWGALVLLLNRNNEEQFKNRVRQVVWMAVGFGLLVASFTIVDKMFFGTQGEIMQTGDVVQFGVIARSEINGFINFITSFAIALAVLYLVLSGVRLIFSGGNEENRSKAIRGIIFSVLGITLMFLAYTIVDIFFGFNQSGQLQGINLVFLNVEFAKWTNILLGFVAFFAVVALVWAGILMIANFGNEEAVNKAKKIFIYVLIGIVLAFSAWTIVRFVVLPGINS